MSERIGPTLDNISARIGRGIGEGSLAATRWRDALVDAGNMVDDLINEIEDALPATPGQGDGLDAAWNAAEAALPDGERLVLWQQKDGPRYIQVLAPDDSPCECGEDDCGHTEGMMAPRITVLADYPSKGLGKPLIEEFRNLAERLATPAPDREP